MLGQKRATRTSLVSAVWTRRGPSGGERKEGRYTKKPGSRDAPGHPTPGKGCLRTGCSVLTPWRQRGPPLPFLNSARFVSTTCGWSLHSPAVLPNNHVKPLQSRQENPEVPGRRIQHIDVHSGSHQTHDGEAQPPAQ